MQLTILGSSGSLGGPGNPASGYLLTVDDSPALIMDLGPGALAALQEIHDPCDAHMLFSHLHSDHCADFPSLMVWRRYHPTSPASARHLCHGPSNTATHLGAMTAATAGKVDDMSDTFEFSPWEPGREYEVSGLRITPYDAVHPVEAYSLRITDPATGRVLVYSGDSAWTETLIDCARDADVFLCEASWPTEEGPRPDGIHLSGTEAGRLARLAGAKKLILVHIPPWESAEEILAAARSEYDGPLEVGTPGMVVQV